MNDNKETCPQAETRRRPYSPPVLRKFGSIQANTASGSGFSTENRGNDYQPTKQRV